MKRSVIIWTIALILVAVAVYTTYQYNNSPAPVSPTEPAQSQAPSVTPDTGENNEIVQDSIDAIDFKLKELNGQEVSLSDYKGKVIYLNFWATWCPPCKAEMPFIQKLYADNKESDLVILTVDIQEPQSTVEKFMKDNKYTFPVLLDKDGEAASAYGVQNIPLSLLIDKDFKIVSAYEGGMESFEMLSDFVNQLKEIK